MIRKVKRYSRLILVLILALVAFSISPAKAEEKMEAAKSKQANLARISITGSLLDALPPENPFGPSPMYFKKMLDLIHKAAEDKEVHGLILKVDSPQIGFSKTKELVKALKSFKDTGKKIFGYSEGLGMKDLMILSSCDHLAIPESGIVVLPGLSIEVMYYKKFFEKIGVEFLVEHIGDYKSAYENYSRENMSNPLREVLNDLLDEFYFSIISTIADNRGINQLDVMKAIDGALISPDEALELGLVDDVCYEDEFKDHVTSFLKVDKINIEKKYGRSDKDLDLDNPFTLFSQIMSTMTGKKKKESKNPKIAVIYASGPIHSGKNSINPFSQEVSIGSETLSKAILDAADDETVKAIVLRVDSPGGSGLASDIIWRAEMKAKAKKPFIVSMADIAGSGGYYISMAADMILAERSTLTGSIGVVSAIPNISKTLDMIGINVERMQRGKNAGLMSLYAPPKDVNVGLLAEYMEDFYWKFVDKVAAGRHMTRDQVHKIAQGRVWTGKQALKNGLVDALGGLEDAIQIAKIKAGLTDAMNWELKEMPESPDFFEALSESMGVEMLLKAMGHAVAPDSLDNFILNRPEIRARLSQLATIWNICQDEKLLLLMPADIQVQF